MSPPTRHPSSFLLASLSGLTLTAVVLIGWPLWRLRAGWRATSGKAALVGYFAALGAGFMLVEVALIQRFTVFVGDPTLAVATVLGALLVSSGVGSYAARTWRAGRRNIVPLAVAWILVALFFFASPLLRGLLWGLLAMPDAVRIGVCVVLVGAVGIAMGMPFPAGLTRIADRAAPFVPWAWGINALLSVVASLSSYLLGMILGYTPMFYIGAGLYGTALLLWRRL